MSNQNVFSNTLILDCIFGFSKLEDIKCFRQVCRQWNAVAIPFLKKSSLISFRKPYYTLQHFYQLFEDSHLGTDFTAVKLSSSPDKYLKWQIGDFTQILEDRKNSMTELNVDRVKLKGHVPSDFYIRRGFDFDPYIGPSVSKLRVSAVDKMIISTNRCVSIKTLSLDGCQLKITSGIKIKPTELVLKKVSVKFNGHPESSSLNEFVNFDNLKSLSLESVRYREGDSWTGWNGYLSFHLRDPVTVKRLDLCGRDLHVDFKNSKWKVTEKFTLSHIKFLEPNEMEVSSFEIHGGAVELSVLPRNLKRLKITDRVTKVLASEPINLKELEILHILLNPLFHGPEERQIGCISHFNNCKNLTTMMLTTTKIDDNRLFTFDIATLPKSVRKLYICGNVEFYGEAESFQLNQLHVRWSRPHSLYSILRRFKGDELAVDLRFPPNSDSVFETVLDISQRPFDNITVAHNDGNQESSFKSSPLSEITNVLSGFYIFTKGFGTAIPKSKFEEIFEVWETFCKN